ncbi:MAG: AAA family ATPase [Candidatus Wallbacteria bacterium]|nr:AAA family ATPase [Candidatus Wallbacteria bacterium]
MKLENLPKWAREIVRFLSIRPQFALWGNIYDIYPFEKDGRIVTFKITDYLREILKSEGFDLILEYEPLYGFSMLDGDPEVFKKIMEGKVEQKVSEHNPRTAQGIGMAATAVMAPVLAVGAAAIKGTDWLISRNKPLLCSLSKGYDIIEKLTHNDLAYVAVILKYVSRLSDICSPVDQSEFYYRLFRLLHNSSPKMIGGSRYPKFNTTIFVMDKENDIPAWFTIGNPKMKVISIPKPDNQLRKAIVQNVAKNLGGFETIEEVKRKDYLSLFVDQTNELYASEIISIVNLAKKENISFADIGDAIKRYKLGIIENPWSKLDPVKINDSESILMKRVKGQPRALRKAADIIKRSVYNLSGSQYSKFSQKPKGVMFLAGPTGVGKTELAKSLAELIFGSETSYVRFDMSEFSREHTDQRMIGAPPGYVGYEVGGELTNAVKQNPFAVLLFDEIEKAHPKILDIFLQLLDDGRLSSGRGETVYFSECLIIFTSNLGVYEIGPSGEKIQRIKPEMGYEQIEQNVRNAIEDYFKFTIQRPEILNRIGENVVIFDYIRKEVAGQIFEKMLSNVVGKLTETFRIDIRMEPEFKEKLRSVCCENLAMGGRGIGNKVEEILVNPISRSLFQLSAKEGEIYTLTDIEKENGSWQLKMKKVA